MIYNRLHCVVPQIMSDWYGVDGLLIVWVLCVCCKPEDFCLLSGSLGNLETLHTTRAL